VRCQATQSESIGRSVQLAGTSHDTRRRPQTVRSRLTSEGSQVRTLLRPQYFRIPVGHAPPCMTAANMASRRVYRRAPPHLESPESRKKSKRKYRISRYGLTQDDFNLLWKIQGYACGMCRELFAEGQLIHVDHDHECCR
jgi:hypothetical protein